jgi:L-threonylcarbamoyladenylate synthase
MQTSWRKAEKVLENDGVVVLPTDTLYGIVGKALSEKAVEDIYKIKGRNEDKPFIVLITSYKDLEIFGVKIDKEQAKFLEKIWPGKVSVILSCNLAKFKYIHRGTNGIAFRMIAKKNKNLFNLIQKVGPLVAPSANPEGEKPAENIQEAKIYFSYRQGLCPNLYINGGIRQFKPSTLVKLENNDFVVLRQGEVKIK